MIENLTPGCKVFNKVTKKTYVCDNFALVGSDLVLFLRRAHNKSRFVVSDKNYELHRENENGEENGKHGVIAGAT